MTINVNFSASFQIVGAKKTQASFKQVIKISFKFHLICLGFNEQLLICVSYVETIKQLNMFVS